MRKRGITRNFVEPLQSLQELTEINPTFLAMMGTSVFPTAPERLQKIQPAGSASKAKSLPCRMGCKQLLLGGREITLLAMRKVCRDTGMGHYCTFFCETESVSLGHPT